MPWPFREIIGADMVQYLLLGGGFGFAAVVQPGPLQAFLLSRAASDGWKRTLPAAFSPLLSDGPIAMLVLLVVGRLPTGGQLVLRGAGGALLIYLAYAAFRAAGAAQGVQGSLRKSPPRTLLQAVGVNLFNPNPYLGWALVLGPAAITAWRESPVRAVALVAAFYGVIVSGLAAVIVLGSAARLLSEKTQRLLVLVSAGVLGVLGAYQLIVCAYGTGVA